MSAPITPIPIRPLVAVARGTNSTRADREANADALRVVAREIEAMSDWLQSVWDKDQDECDEATLDHAENVLIALRSALAPFAAEIVAHERALRADHARRGVPSACSVTLFGTTLRGTPL